MEHHFLLHCCVVCANTIGMKNTLIDQINSAVLSNIYQRIANTIGMKNTLIDQINSAVLTNICQRIANTIRMKNTLVVYSFLKYPIQSISQSFYTI